MDTSPARGRFSIPPASRPTMCRVGMRQLTKLCANRRRNGVSSSNNSQWKVITSAIRPSLGIQPSETNAQLPSLSSGCRFHEPGHLCWHEVNRNRSNRQMSGNAFTERDTTIAPMLTVDNSLIGSRDPFSLIPPVLSCGHCRQNRCFERLRLLDLFGDETIRVKPASWYLA